MWSKFRVRNKCSFFYLLFRLSSKKLFSEKTKKREKNRNKKKRKTVCVHLYQVICTHSTANNIIKIRKIDLKWQFILLSLISHSLLFFISWLRWLRWARFSSITYARIKIKLHSFECVYFFVFDSFNLNIFIWYF